MKVLSQTCPILLVDDNPHDYEATKRCFKQIGITNPLMYCADGDEALDLLQGQSTQTQYARPPRPSLILLDLNLPGTDGREVLNQLKQSKRLKSIPVVVLTTSSDPNDIHACYDKGANSYVVKPVDYDGLLEAMRSLCQFWLEVAEVPSMA
ncbi:response regulator [Candidatus Nitronereus thalassa]|uniref:Response regulator n=1 Tax=Candidatus Nitronereus thalassa TaxID=3020898 RepID=A0ABU3K804_9BACT|nr:response regulator [Candidatus Nitronereus thalassa]MDT7042489.1 response regulator [Candidatus Nitronereus thalassa]